MIGKTIWSKGRNRLEEIENVAQKQRIQSISIQIKVYKCSKELYTFIFLAKIVLQIC